MSGQGDPWGLLGTQREPTAAAAALATALDLGREARQEGEIITSLPEKLLKGESH